MIEIGNCPPRVAKVSRWMAGLCLLPFIALPLLYAHGIYDRPAKVFTYGGGAQLGITDFGREQITLFAVSMILSLPVFWALLLLRQLFACYAKGDIFSSVAARHLSRFALAWFLSTVASVLARFARAAVISPHGPCHSAQCGVSIGTGDVSALFSAVIFMIIAWVLAEAAVVAEEHRGFV